MILENDFLLQQKQAAMTKTIKAQGAEYDHIIEN